MRLSVIIPHFYREREPNLRRIVDSLRAGTVVPDEIIIWNNERLRWITVEGALVIQSPRNVRAQARLIAAMMARGDRLLFLDNDVAVRKETVANLITWHSSRGGVVTLEGRERLHPRFKRHYSQWPKIYGRGLTEPHVVFLSLGRGEMVDRSTLLSVLKDFPFEETTVMDDMYLSSAYACNGVPVCVVPCVPGKSDLEDLPMGGVGLCKTPNFNEERTRVALTIACDPETLRSQAESA